MLTKENNNAIIYIYKEKERTNKMRNLTKQQLITIFVIYFLLSNLFFFGTFFNIIFTYLIYKLVNRIVKVNNNLKERKNKTRKQYR